MPRQAQKTTDESREKSLREAASLCGIGHDRLRVMCESGVVESRSTGSGAGKRWIVYVPSVVQALVDEAKVGPGQSDRYNGDQEKARKAFHDANIAEMKDAEMAGRLVDRETIQEAVTSAVVGMRQELLNASSAVAQIARNAASSTDAAQDVHDIHARILRGFASRMAQAAQTTSGADEQEAAQ
ncbi:MAG: hypothetical protein ACPGOY_13865 [Rhodospirillaceae bacterium]